jgi:CheY-like chemotaxis protein
VQEKAIVLAVRHDEEREAIAKLLEGQGMTVYHAQTGRDVICFIEDYHCELLLTDIQLPDMHAWNMLNKINEIKPTPNVSLLVLSDDVAAAPLRNVKLMVRPVALATIKQIVTEWSA